MAGRPEDLLAAIMRLGVELPGTVVDAVCAELDEMPEPGSGGATRVLACVTQPTSRKSLAAVLRTWEAEHPDLPGAAIAWSLRSAAATDAWHRIRQQVELVWSGPAPHGTTLRRTDQALLEMIRAAKASVTIVTFAAYRVPEIHDALVAASQRGVRLTFIAESLGDKVSFDPLPALGATLAKHVAVYVWPLEERQRDEKGRHGTLHAKCAIIDDERILISSANFTGDAMALNLELGLLVEGGEIPRQVSDHFALLCTRGVLRLVT